MYDLYRITNARWAVYKTFRVAPKHALTILHHSTHDVPFL